MIRASGSDRFLFVLIPYPSGLSYKLTVVSDFEDPAVASAVETVLRDHSVSLVKMADVDAYVDEVRREAHE